MERDHVLGPRLRPPHRTSELAREPRDEHALDLELLRPEAAADVVGDDANLPGSSPSMPEMIILAVCGVCEVPQYVSRPSSPSSGSRRARLHRRRGHPLAPDGVRDDDVAVFEEVPVVLLRAGAGCHVVPAPGKRSISSFAASSTVRTTGSGS